MFDLLKKETFLLLLCSIPAAVFANVFDITKYGAVNDGKTVNTKAIQKAIDDCTKKGGIVLVPAGRFVTGTIYLKSNVTLQVDKGATLYGSIDTADYTPNAPTSISCPNTHDRNGKSKKNFALIYAEGQENIAITGDGTINGNGDSKVFQKGDNGPARPKLIFLISCKNVKVSKIFLTNSAFWMQDYTACDGVYIDGIKVFNHTNFNQDGLDIDSKNVVVTNCIIDSDDDGICLKSYIIDKPCENVTITNCVVATNCNAIKFGTPGYGGFKNIAINNISVNAASQSNFRNWTTRYKKITTDPSMVSGISLECADGGTVDGVLINNVVMKATQTPIFIKISNRQAKMHFDTTNRVAAMRNVIISNIIADAHSRRTSSVTGYPGVYVENVQLKNIIINQYSIAAKDEVPGEVKENEGGYPSTHMLGEVLPANVFYLRHVKDILLEDVQVNLHGNDERTPVVIEDATGVQLKNISVKKEASGAKHIGASDVKTVTSSDIRVDGKNVN